MDALTRNLFPTLFLLECPEGRGADATVDAVGCEAAGSPVHRALGVYGKLEAGSPQAINFAIHATCKGG